MLCQGYIFADRVRIGRKRSHSMPQDQVAQLARSVIANRVNAPAEHDQHGTLAEPLEVNHQVIGFLSQLPDKGNNLPKGCQPARRPAEICEPLPAPGYDNLVKMGVPDNNAGRLFLHHPGNRAARNIVMQQLKCGKGVNHITDGTQLDYQYLHGSVTGYHV